MSGAENIVKSSIKAGIEKILKEDYEYVDENQHLKDNLNMDSLDYVEFSMEVEKEFDISIPDDILEGLENGTVGNFIEKIQRFVIDSSKDTTE